MSTIQAGTKIVIQKGCRDLGLHKYTHGVVTEVRELGREFGHSVRVTFLITTGFKSGKTIALYARHKNRLGDLVVGLNSGNPSHRIEVGRYA